MPWSWKTSIWKVLAQKLSMNFLDFDDDVIEWEMWKPVSECLEEMWEKKFLKMEEDLALKLNLENTVLATSGSIPLSEKAMDHLRKQWFSILLNIPIEAIENRLNLMLVDRIVWMNDDMDLRAILEWRKDFYHKHHDYSFDNSWDWTPDKVSEEFWEWIKNQDIQLYKKLLW